MSDDILVIGEALVDIVRHSPPHPTSADHSTASPAADPTENSTEHPGGSPANVALGLGRLGRSVALLTRLGDDDRGRRILAHLHDSQVRVLPESIAAPRTSTAVATLDAEGRASYDFDIDWRLPADIAVPLRALDGAAAVHTGSIATFLQPGGDAVRDLIVAARGRATVSYDPNARPALMGDPRTARERVQTFVAASDVVKVSDEDLAWLCPGTDPEDVAADWLERGPAVVVVTRGADGAFAHCAAGRTEVPGLPITVADTVGAGDSFSAALLDHLAGADLLGAERLEALRAVDVEQVAAMLRHAVRVSAITCQRAGADPPWRSEPV